MKIHYCLLCIFVMLSVIHAEPAVWYVHPDSTLNSIQAGLDSCANNDVVLVAPGTYHENIVWPNTQGIHLISELGPEMTIIDGDSAGRVITIASSVDSTTIIRALTIQNGLDSLNGGGILCDASSPVITDNIIIQNHARAFLGGGYGGGICCNNSAAIIKYNVISNNLSSEGGGIYCDPSSSLIITGNTITGNTASGWWGYGGGIDCHSSSTIIDSNIISGNIASGPMDAGGGGIYCYHASPIISSNTITGNGPTGVICVACSSATLSGNTISNNTGHGISVVGAGSPILVRNCVNGNGIDYGYGIYCDGNSSPIIDSCTISGNANGGIFCYNNDAVPTIRYCDIYGNQGYGVFNDNFYFRTDAILNWWGDSTGPYHPTLNPAGLGDSVSDYVDFDPWLYWPGTEEQLKIERSTKPNTVGATIFAGPLVLPVDKACNVFDITGRQVYTHDPVPGIYFIEVDGIIGQKVIKIY